MTGACEFLPAAGMPGSLGRRGNRVPGRAAVIGGAVAMDRSSRQLRAREIARRLAAEDGTAPVIRAVERLR